FNRPTHDPCRTIDVLIRVAATAGAVLMLGCEDSARRKLAPPPADAVERPASARPPVSNASEHLQPVRQSPPTLPQPDPPAGICGQRIYPREVTVQTSEATIFIEPRELRVPLASLPVNTRLTVFQPEGDWYLIEFQDPRWGRRMGYVHCSKVI